MPNKDRDKQRESSRLHYRNNREVMVARAAAFKITAIHRNQEYVWEYLVKHPCVDCEEDDPVVLTFDHRDVADKVDEVCNMIRNACSLDRIQREIERCDVRCANCHLRKTHQQLGWWKGKHKP